MCYKVRNNFSEYGEKYFHFYNIDYKRTLRSLNNNTLIHKAFSEITKTLQFSVLEILQRPTCLFILATRWGVLNGFSPWQSHLRSSAGTRRSYSCARVRLARRVARVGRPRTAHAEEDYRTRDQ